MSEPSNTPTDVFVAVGSNIKPQDYIFRALLALKTYQPIAISNFYKTAAVGRLDQPDFFNGVVKIQTVLSPRRLKFDVLRKIESQLGRVRTSDKFAPRTIDLDMILYGTLVIDEADIKIPDPSIRLYPFVAVPLLELAPKLILPDTHTPLADEPVVELKADLRPLPEFTEYLRQIFLA
jgi:2-amino-4-hydroxy-6-hydroxymethyldihydropteridine diphosphokinase